MAEQSEYELLPHEELQELREEIARLKQDPLAATSQADDLKHAVDRLTVTMNKFISLMTKTNEELLDQFQQTSFIEQFAKMSANQEQIAKGIVSVAKMLKKMQENKPKESPEAPTPHLESGFPQQSINQQQMDQPYPPGMNPNMSANMNQGPSEMPPLPQANDMPPLPGNNMPPVGGNATPQPPAANPAPPQPTQQDSLPQPPNIPQDDMPPVQEPLSNPSGSDLPPPPPHKHGLFHRK